MCCNNSQNISPHRLQRLPYTIECIEALLRQRTLADALDIRLNLLDRASPDNDSVVLA